MTALHIVYFVAILMALVLIHEAGHMWVARWCGMRVERFSIFFGRPLKSFRRGETEYAIGWLPLGGYVKISGMTRGEEMPPEVEPRAYYNAPAWKKIAVIAAGPAVNVLLAIAIFAVIFWIGIPTVLPTDRVSSVQTGSAAAQAGLHPGDRLLSVDGVPVKGNVDVIRRELQAGAPGDPVRLTVARDGRSVPLSGRLQVLRDSTGRPVTDPATGRPVSGLGFTFTLMNGPTERFGPVDGLVRGWDFGWYIIRTNVRVIGQSFTNAQAREQVSSIVGVGAVFNQVSNDGLVTVLRFIGVISLALGIFNLLPILPLDGGHIVFAIAERLKGGGISRTTYERASFVGFAILMVIFVIALQNDIGRLTGEGFQVGR